MNFQFSPRRHQRQRLLIIIDAEGENHMRSRWMRNTCGLCVTNSLTPEDQFHISANITIVDSRRLAVHQWTFISQCVQSQAAFTRLAVHPNH